MNSENLSRRPTIVVSRRWPARVEKLLTERFDVHLNAADSPLSPRDWLAVVRDSDAICPTVTDHISADIIAAAGPRLRLIANFGVGFEHIDLAAARARGLVVTNTPDVLTDATADLAVALMLAVARRLVEGDAELRRGVWSGWRPTHMLGRQLSGKVLGLVGFGRIARAVAQRAHFGFGMRVQTYSPRLTDSGSTTPVSICASLDQLLSTSDFVSLHCPANADTRHLMNAARLRQMKPEAFLINTARGVIVDERALVDALKNGVIAGAGLDVYEREPEIAPGLVQLSNTVLLPHLGSATEETRIAMGLRVLSNLDAFFGGDEPPDRIA
jgi:lactate dehydrogenase-like 2-hydroxyacid dehydrogenase